MKLYRQKQNNGVSDGITGIAAIFKISVEPPGKATLIGSGFWLTEKGHVVTNRHVIDDNIGADGVDEGPIFAIQTFADRRAVPRALRKTYRHETYDLALSETLAPEGHDDPTWTFTSTLDEPKVGDPISTYSFVAINQKFDGEKYDGITTDGFMGRLTIPDQNLDFELTFATRINQGHVLEIHPDGRDRVMLPFPCFRSDLPIYGAHSGGPVFDKSGRVCGINCTSFEGQDISYHMPLNGILTMMAPEIELIPEDPHPRSRTVHELMLTHRVVLDPPLADIVFGRGRWFISFRAPFLSRLFSRFRTLKAWMARIRS